MNICHFIPIRLSERAINRRFEEIQRVLCYAVSAAQAGDVVYTQNSATVTWSGTGTQADPLIATVVGSTSGANPTATIGLTAVNGVATTFMRSDAAPALSQAIVPTWTGLHTFSAGLVSNPPGATAVSALNNVASATFPTAFFQKVENGDGVITNAVFPLDCVVMRCNYGANAIKVGQGVNLKFQMQQASTIRESFRIAAIADNAGGTQSHAEFWVQNTTSIQAQTLKATGQLQLNQYTTVGSFTGTAIGHIAFDSAGNLLTVGLPATAANPTAQVGLAVINGSAATFMRSDAAPAINQAITPTWTGLHTFSAAALFTPAAAPAYAEGKLYYDNSFSALSYMDDISGTSIQIGYEGLVRARNNTGSTITNGQVVYISGSVGQNPSIALAQANSLATSGVIGIATHDIPNNTVGKVTVFGLVNDINTSGFTEGDVLYLSATTPGAFTNTPPSSPNVLVSLGSVQTTHVTQGKILVTIGRGLATDVALGTSNSIAPTQNAVKTYVDNKFGVTTVQNDATGPVAITAVQSGTIFTNTGAAVNVQFNLPAATVGLHYEFVNTVGATTSAMIVRANGTDTIRNTTESAAGGAVQSGSAASGDSIKVICHTAGKWMVMFDGAGDWSVIA